MCYEHLAVASSIAVRNLGRVIFFLFKILQMLLQKVLYLLILNNINKSLSAQRTM
jgi:hypothetical protein